MPRVAREVLEVRLEYPSADRQVDAGGCHAQEEVREVRLEYPSDTRALLLAGIERLGSCGRILS